MGQLGDGCEAYIGHAFDHLIELCKDLSQDALEK